MSKNKISEEFILDEIKTASEDIGNDQIEEIISDEDIIAEKSRRLDTGKFKKFINKVRLSFSLIKDYKSRVYTDIPWRTIAMTAVSLLYFVNPFDMMPDLLPVLGFADDAILFASLFKSIQADLEKYCQWKGLNPEEYF
ncbi:MAG: hypothetical protein HGGPFJEG_00004 [Ignavibacteria bacterium]|nr:hypothetical protein [Ignavibacteria bacterium]